MVHGVAKSQTRLSDFTFTFMHWRRGNPLQCSCLENPRDGEAWWAAVYRVTQSWTRLKRLGRTPSAPLLRKEDRNRGSASTRRRKGQSREPPGSQRGQTTALGQPQEDSSLLVCSENECVQVEARCGSPRTFRGWCGRHASCPVVSLPGAWPCSTSMAGGPATYRALVCTRCLLDCSAPRFSHLQNGA